MVPAGRPVLSLLPPGNIKVRFYVPEAALPAIAYGDTVKVTCDGALQVVVDREQGVGGFDRVALAHRQRLHSPDLVRGDEDEIGLDPALIAIVRLAAGREQERGDTGDGGEQSERPAVHGGLRGRNKRSK
jgi:HlyD family secretion protein